MASLQIEIPATGMPVSLAEAKNFLRVDTTDDDALITILIQAATNAAETFTARSLCTKGYIQCLDSFPYFTDTVMSQMAFPPSYYALPRYSTTLWNYSQMIKLFAPPLIAVQRITFLCATDQQWHDLVPIPPLWYPGTAYTIGMQVMDNNANVQQCTHAGASDANPPTWNTTLGGFTTEQNPDPSGEGSGGVVWQNKGPSPVVNAQTTQGQFGAFMVDNQSEPARIFPGPPGNFWPQVLYVPNAVQIHFTAGYSADETLVPGDIKAAILQSVAAWYEHREAIQPGRFDTLPWQAQMLLYSKRVFDFQPTRG
jgi:hypothetical protein